MTSKEQIVSFLETIPTMDLPEVFDALDHVCLKIGIPSLRSEDHDDLIIRYEHLEGVIERSIEFLEDESLKGALELLLTVY